MTSDSLNAQLLEAVAHHRVAEVKRLLERGANPNYDSYAGETAEEKEAQPYNPMRMVVFCISDSIVGDEGLINFKEIAQLLIQYGAETKPAIELAVRRYGKNDPSIERAPFMQVLDVIEEANRFDGA